MDSPIFEPSHRLLSGSSMISIASGTKPYLLCMCWKVASMNSAYSAGSWW